MDARAKSLNDLALFLSSNIHKLGCFWGYFELDRTASNRGNSSDLTNYPIVISLLKMQCCLSYDDDRAILWLLVVTNGEKRIHKTVNA